MFTHIVGFTLSRVDVGTLEVMVAREETPACLLIVRCLAHDIIDKEKDFSVPFSKLFCKKR